MDGKQEEVSKLQLALDTANGQIDELVQANTANSASRDAAQHAMLDAQVCPLHTIHVWVLLPSLVLPRHNLICCTLHKSCSMCVDIMLAALQTMVSLTSQRQCYAGVNIVCLETSMYAGW